MSPQKELNLFAKRLKEARENSKLTKSELAAKAGISKSMMTAYEDAENDPRQSLVQKFSIILSVNIAWLMGAAESNSFHFVSEIEETCNLLNDSGRRKVLDYSLDLLNNEKYKKGFIDCEKSVG